MVAWWADFSAPTGEPFMTILCLQLRWARKRFEFGVPLYIKFGKPQQYISCLCLFLRGSPSLGGLAWAHKLLLPRFRFDGSSSVVVDLLHSARCIEGGSRLSVHSVSSEALNSSSDAAVCPIAEPN